MGRKRVYADRAEQMRAYRARRQHLPTTLPPVAASAVGRTASRPARLQALIETLQVMQGDYEAWLDRMPDALVDSPTGEKLIEAVAQFAEAAEVLMAIDLPRGYGRD